MDTTLQTTVMDLLEERDLARHEYTTYVFNAIADTVGSALCKLFGVEFDAFKVKNVDIVDGVLMISFVVRYNPSLEQSPFMARLDAPSEGESPIDAYRAVIIGLPFTLIDKSPEIIEQFLLDIADGVDPVDAIAAAENQLPANLTAEQQHMMQLFQHTLPETLQ